MTYGIRFTRADGSVALELDETFAGLIHSESLPYDFIGTFGVPDFDSDKGMFYVQFELVPRGYGGWFTLDARVPIYGAAILPSLSWDNTAKVMTVAPASIPAQFPILAQPDYTVLFLHYR